MSKKRKWWQQGTLYDEDFEDRNSSSVTHRIYDENGNLESEDYDFYESDFNRELGESKKKVSVWDEYKTTGVWKGYSHYKKSQLSYKYVQQMANGLASQHRVNVVVGKDWVVDIPNKVLIYNPLSLVSGTKSELLATLMHEIGKLRYVTVPSQLNAKYIQMYKFPAVLVQGIFEDTRVDYKMIMNYESAYEIFESAIPSVKKQIEALKESGEHLRYHQVVSLQRLIDNNKEDIEKLFGCDIHEARIKAEKMKRHYQQNGNIFEYSGEMLTLMYDIESNQIKSYDNINDKIDKTVHTIEPVKKFETSQEMYDYLDKEMYPVVEDLLKEALDGGDKLSEEFPNMSQGAKDYIKKQLESVMRGLNNHLNMKIDSNGDATGIRSNSSGESDDDVPSEWFDGDYKVLKESVDFEIKELIQKLTFLRREELTVKYKEDQKRGKLNAKKLYKVVSGGRRLFKKKLEQIDTIQSFAFSILVDVSGSMSGSRLAHATRGCAIFAEVFKKMNIPFEIITFDDGAKTVKKFQDTMNAKLESKIGGIATINGGGTNMHNALKAVDIHKQPENNKVVIVLSDGGVSNFERLDDEYFIPWQKKNVKSIAFGIECGDEVKRLVCGTGRSIEMASKLPMEFSSLLKEIIKR